MFSPRSTKLSPNKRRSPGRQKIRGSTPCRTPPTFIHAHSRYFLRMVDQALWHVTCFYRFVSIDEERLDDLRLELKAWSHEHGLHGLVIVAPEGINGTVSGDETILAEFKALICRMVGTEDIRFKDSVSQVRPFRRMTVDRRSEIVGLKRPDLVPDSPENRHLSPQQWHAMLSRENPPLLIDTRNTYETLTGKFKGAVDPGLKTFSDWATYLDKAELSKDEPVLIYCTGGIRCEKAILAMHDRGFDKVYQLRDGILGYLAEYPNGLFEGDCFVFDDRVALNQELKPSGRFGICPGCGLTSGDKRECEWCGKEYYVCTACEPTWDPVCGKPCRDRWRRHGPKQQSISNRS